MDTAKIVGDFFLSLWIWQMTFDLFHPAITLVAMYTLLRFSMGRKRVRSLAIAVGAQLAVLGILTAIVPALLINTLGWSYEPLDLSHAVGMMRIFVPALSLGIFYALVQIVYFAIGRIFWRYNLISYVALTLISNGVGVAVSYLLIRAVEFSYYAG